MRSKFWLVAILAGAGLLCIGNGASAQTFSNPAPITINDALPATPYPSSIAVSGVTGTVTKVTIAITGFSHTFPDDVGILLVGPTGVSVIIADGPGDGTDVVNLNWVFDDAAAGPLPSGGALVSGTFQANGDYNGNDFSAPAPARPFGTALSLYNGLNPNGTWNLFVEDFAGQDVGVISGGWSVTFTTAGAAVPEPTTIALGAIAGAPMLYMVRKIRRKRVRVSKK